MCNTCTTIIQCLFQDPEFTEKIRSKSGVPLLFIAYNTIQIESPTSMSKTVAQEKLEHKLDPSDYALDKIKELKRETFGESEEPRIKRKRKQKGANPLSCKKKKKRTEEELNELKKKKKRQKIKKSKVTLESLASLENT